MMSQLMRQLFCKIKTHAGRFGMASSDRSGKSFLKDSMKILRLDSDSRIYNVQSFFFTVFFDRKRNVPAFVRIFQRICNDLIKDKSEPFTVGMDGLRNILHMEPNLFINERLGEFFAQVLMIASNGSSVMK